MKTPISKAYRGGEHIGWKKTVAGREWFLFYGTSPADERRAITIATALVARWQLVKLSGGTALSDTDFAEAKAIALGHANGEARSEPRLNVEMPIAAPAIPAQPPESSSSDHKPPSTSPTTGPRRWLYESIDEFMATLKRSLKSDGSNADHILNTCERILRARDAFADLPLDVLRRKELDDWLLGLLSLKNKFNGQPLGPVTIRNLAASVRAAVTKFIEWEWMEPPKLWERAFKGYSIKKLETPAQRKVRRKKPPTHSPAEKRVLWRTAFGFAKAMMALADWAGHTQNEIATLTFDEIKYKNGEMYIVRDRNKTGVRGRWWIPPEPAAAIAAQVKCTPRDPAINPRRLAFLTPRQQPLVHRSDKMRRGKTDYIGQSLWPSLLLAARYYGVRRISFKYMRKGMSQRIRNIAGREVSKTFLAHAAEDVQDENYTRASLKKVERASRKLYERLKSIYLPPQPNEWQALKEQIRQENAKRLAKSGAPAPAEALVTEEEVDLRPWSV